MSVQVQSPPLRHDEQEAEDYYDDRDHSCTTYEIDYDNNDEGTSSSSSSILKGRINYSQKKLYGRQSHLDKLHASFQKLQATTTNSKSYSTEKQEQPQSNGHGRGIEKPIAAATVSTKLATRSSLSTTVAATVAGADGTINNKTEIVFLAGVSGTGKSALVTEFIKQLNQQQEGDSSLYSSPPNHLFISGKHEELHSSTSSDTPYSAISGALNRMCSDFLQLEKSDLERRIATLKDAVGDQGKVLIDMIPNLAKLLLEEEEDKDGIKTTATVTINTSSSASNTTTGDMVKKENVLKYVFQSFIKALCSPVIPVIMFLDDLQWADKATLDLLKSLLIDQPPQYFMFIGSFRSNEIDEETQLFEVLTEIRKTTIGVERIELLDLHQDDIGEFIADSLNLTLQQALPLTEVVYGKTRGNIFFTKQSLEELLHKNALYYDLIAFRWEWNLTKVELETCLSDTAVEAVKSKLRTLPEKLQRALTVASYTRSTFDVSTLVTLMNADGSYSPSTSIRTQQLAKILDKAVVKGLLINCVGTMQYSFAHDNIQQAAYSLVSDENDANQLRINIAKVLLDIPASEREDWMLFAAADNLNTVPSHDMDPIAQSKLNLEVGEKSAAISALGSASIYLRKSMDTLKQAINPWETEYDLSLRLYRVSADVELALGNYDLGYKLSETVLEKAKTLDEKLPTYISYGLGLDRNNKHSESIDVQRNALVLLEQYPSKFLTFRILKDFCKIRSWLKTHSDEDILNLSKMTDERKLAAMQLLTNVSFEAYLTGEIGLHMFAILRRLCITFRYGLCAQSAVAFAQYGIVLCTAFKDQIAASRMGEIARQVIDVVRGKHVYSIVEFTVSVFIEVLASPTSEYIANCERGYRYGLECGENAHTTYNLSACIGMHFHSGYNLGDVLKLTNGLIRRTTILKDENMTTFHRPWQVLMEHLVGESKSPKNWRDVFTDLSTSGFGAEKLRQAYCYRLQLAVYFSQVELAYEQAQLLKAIRCTGADDFVNMLYLYFSCLACTAMVRRTGQRKHLSEAMKATKEIQALMRKRGRTFWHKVLLMEAECEASRKNPKMSLVLGSYERAIAASRDGGFISDEALATELAGTFLLKQNCDLTGRDYLRSAREIYIRWGAQGKADQMTDMYGDLLNYPSSTLSKLNKIPSQQSTTKTPSLRLLESVSGSESLSGKVSLDLGLISRSSIVSPIPGGGRSGRRASESRSEDPWTTIEVDVVEKRHIIPASDISCITMQSATPITIK